MNKSLIFFFAGLAGVGLGAIFFGGLWWTIRRGISSSRPAAWFLGSAVLRMGVTLAGFYVVGGGEWTRLVACLTGFLTARLAVTWLTRSTEKIPPESNREASHAP
jgi:F1F0 ATPase subunit 2